MEELNLKSIIAQYPQSLDSPKMLKGYILDLYPQCPRGLVNAVMAVAESHILKEMRAVTVVQTINTSRWVGHLENEYGYFEKFAQKAVYLWCDALGKVSEQTIKSEKKTTEVSTVMGKPVAAEVRTVDKNNKPVKVAVRKKSEGVKSNPKKRSPAKTKQPGRFVYMASNNGPFFEYKLVQVDDAPKNGRTKKSR